MIQKIVLSSTEVYMFDPAGLGPGYPFPSFVWPSGLPQIFDGVMDEHGRETDDVIAIGELFPLRTLSNQALFPAKPIYIVTSTNNDFLRLRSPFS